MGFIRRLVSKDASTSQAPAGKTSKEMDKHIEKLTRELRSGPDWVGAAAALAATGDTRAIDALFARLKQYNDNNWCLFDALAVFKIDDVARRILASAAGHYSNWPLRTRESLMSALVSIGETAVGPICEELEKPEGESSLGAQASAKLLRDIGSPSALPAVKRYLQQSLDDGLDLDAVHRPIYLVEYLAGEHDPGAIDLVMKILMVLITRFHEENTAWSHRRSAISLLSMACIEALPKMGAKQAIPLLESVAVHPKAESSEKRSAELALVALGAEKG